MRAQCTLYVLLMTLTLPGLFPEMSNAAVPDTSASESLLSQKDDNEWSLESMMAARRLTGGGVQQGTGVEESHRSRKETYSANSKATVNEVTRRSRDSKMREGSGAQKIYRPKIVQFISGNNEAHRSITTPNASPDIIRLKTALKEKAARIDVLSSQISVLKASLRDMKAKLTPSFLPAVQNDEVHTAIFGILRAHSLNANTQALRDKVQIHQVSLSQKENELARLTASHEAHLAEVEKELKNQQQYAMSLRLENTSLKSQLQNKNARVTTLNSALVLQSDLLRQASTGIAELRERYKQQDTPLLNTETDRQTYMAGVMVSTELADRLASWQEAGISVGAKFFRSGINDGLRNTVRLKSAEGRKAQKAFIQAVQIAMTTRIMAAKKQIKILSKGRIPIKSSSDIIWYRLRNGHAVPLGQAVTLSMTEQIAGGRIISNIPPLELHDNEEMPAIIKEGLHLPGEGGEVVAYSLAHSVYGSKPLPPGVRPWTVMEYHLRGGKSTNN